MLYRKFYEQAYHKYLNEENINDYILRVLIMAVQKMDGNMSEFFIKDEELKDEELLKSYIERVIKGEPYQYVINKARFLDYTFYVDSRVLIPRLETEELVITLIKEIKSKFNEKKINILDIGTGSGCIAITLKKHFENTCVFASDISLDALDVAKYNADKLETKIEFLSGDMLEPIIERNIKLDVLVSNPPYIQNKSEVDKGVLDYEPHLALFAEHGIDYYEVILKNANKVMNNNGIIAFEFNYDQKNQIEILIQKYIENAEYLFYQDFNNKWRYVIITYKID
ncbi:MAG: peptide chain release factor N(5)-glutamine methyltransferase [Erysipelotrichales bacterium]|nr:peptide chain release factor N(5)-glutamine methyltransferase [Erysipelotrichales bacterium]